MSSIYSKNLKISLFGESHGEMIGVTIDGICPGIKIDFDFINSELNRRKSVNSLSTPRKEKDEYKVISGIFNGYTTGTPITFLIENVDVDSSKYELIKNTPRPSHADYTNELKYLGFQDYRGGGHSSGRLTAPLVIVGAICKQILKSKNVVIASHIKKLHNICDISFLEFLKNNSLDDLKNDNFLVLDKEKKEEMILEIEKAKEMNDSVGGEIETIILNSPKGIGEPFFDSLESVISSLIFSIPAVKGVSFGKGFEFSNYYGSEVNDKFKCEKNDIITTTNNNGGINGGISNGMPILINTVVKPTPSIKQTQDSVNFKTMENEKITIDGRHDPCIVNRALVVVESMVAIGILDLCVSRYGYLWMK